MEANRMEASGSAQQIGARDQLASWPVQFDLAAKLAAPIDFVWFQLEQGLVSISIKLLVLLLLAGNSRAALGPINQSI